jgi:hypothetical protein
MTSNGDPFRYDFKPGDGRAEVYQHWYSCLWDWIRQHFDKSAVPYDLPEDEGNVDYAILDRRVMDLVGEMLDFMGGQQAAESEDQPKS